MLPKASNTNLLVYWVTGANAHIKYPFDILSLNNIFYIINVLYWNLCLNELSSNIHKKCKIFKCQQVQWLFIIYHLSPCLMFSWPFYFWSPWAVNWFARMNLFFVVNFRTSWLVVFFQIKLVCCFLEIDLASLSFHSGGLMLCLPLRPRQTHIGRAAVQILLVHLDNCDLIDNW